MIAETLAELDYYSRDLIEEPGQPEMPYQVWDGVTFYEYDYGYITTYDEFVGVITQRIIARIASNSADRVTPVVGASCGWLKFSLEEFSQFFWRVPRYTIALRSPAIFETTAGGEDEDEVFADLTIGTDEIDYEGDPSELIERDKVEYPYHSVASLNGDYGDKGWVNPPRFSYSQAYEDFGMEGFVEVGEGSGVINNPVGQPTGIFLGVRIAEASYPVSFPIGPYRDNNGRPGLYVVQCPDDLQHYYVRADSVINFTAAANFYDAYVSRFLYLGTHLVSNLQDPDDAALFVDEMYGNIRGTISLKIFDLDFIVPLVEYQHRYLFFGDPYYDLPSTEAFGLNIELVPDPFFTFGGLYDETTGEPV